MQLRGPVPAGQLELAVLLSCSQVPVLAQTLWIWELVCCVYIIKFITLSY